MVRVTMMRGAQSAGIATYTPVNSQLVGRRCRVVNGKRTDLCDVLMKKCAAMLKPGSIHAPQLLQGHTRFATTSISALPGCHPHQWTPRKTLREWRQTENGTWQSQLAPTETFITHNGDLDFFELHGGRSGLRGWGLVLYIYTFIYIYLFFIYIYTYIYIYIYTHIYIYIYIYI